MRLLVVIDAQSDFITGSLGSEYAKIVADRITTEISKTRSDDTLIVFTKDTHFDNYPQTLEGKVINVSHCKYLEFGWEIYPQIRGEFFRNRRVMMCYPYEYIKTKACVEAISPNTFYKKDAFGCLDLIEFTEQNLARITSIELYGFDTDICVISQAVLMRVHFPNMPISIRADLCCGSSKEAHDAALVVAKSCLIDVI